MRRNHHETATKNAHETADFLTKPVDIAFLAVFRVIFGLLMALDVFWYFQHGFIQSLFIDPNYHFTYFGFSWVTPWPGDWMYVHFAVVGIAGLCVAAGFFYRFAAVTFFAGFAYLFLIDQTLHLNHNYLIILISFLMIWMPANRCYSLDVHMGRVKPSSTTPQWTLWILRFQIGLVYVYGAIAKMNTDWLRGEPLRFWLSGRRDIPVIGPLLDTEFCVYFFSYGGLLFDLLIVPLLMWKRTRMLAIAMCVFFHLTNALIFDIGIFPWMMLAATFIFLPPETMRRWAPFLFKDVSTPSPTTAMSTAIRLFLAVYVLWQVFFPLRLWLYPGNANWTEQGHRFAWHMKLRSKQGWASFRVVDNNTGKIETIEPRRFLTPRQATRMATRPDMVLQSAHILADRYEVTHGRRPSVYADVFCRLNGRKPQRLIDPHVDLAAIERDLKPAAWIVPLHEPLPTTKRTGEYQVIVPLRNTLTDIAYNDEVRNNALIRMIQQQQDRLQQVNGELKKSFNMEEDGYYMLSGRNISRLIPRGDLGQDVVIEPTLENLSRHFDITPHGIIQSEDSMEKYNRLAEQKLILSERIGMLQALLSPVGER